MSAYLLTALLLWVSWIKPIEQRATYLELTTWAGAIAAHCGDDVSRCTFLAALAFEESGFRPDVLNENCNEPGYSLTHPTAGGDDGNAYGPFQLHRGRWLRGADPRHATPDEQARIASTLPEGAWSRVTRGYAHPLAGSYVRAHPFVR